jgi:hypothetical protein
MMMSQVMLNIYAILNLYAAMLVAFTVAMLVLVAFAAAMLVVVAITGYCYYACVAICTGNMVL